MRKFQSRKAIFKSYLYRSKAKIDLLYQQIQDPQVTTTLRWKIDLKVFSWQREKESESEINDQDKLDAVVAALEERQLIGPPQARKPYIKGIFPMRWGIFADEGFRPNTEGCRWRITNNALKEGLLEKRKRVLDQPDGCYSFGPRCAVASWSTQSSSS